MADTRSLRDPSDPVTWRYAYHEAGHVVTAVALGVRFDHVNLHPERGWPPSVAAAVVGLETARRPLPAIVVSLAGMIAESLATGVPLAAALCSTGLSDLAAALTRGDGLPGASMAVLAARAERIVVGTHRESVIAVAEALVEGPQRLTCDQVRAIVDDHQPGGLEHLLRRAVEYVEGTRSGRPRTLR